MSTHVYVFAETQSSWGWRKWGDNFALDPMGKCAERLLLRSAAYRLHPYYTVYSIQTGKMPGAKNQRRRLFECKVIKGHSILYRQPMEINV